MGRSRLRTRTIIIYSLVCIIIFIIGFGIGTYEGAKKTIGFAVSVGMHFVNISVNEGELTDAIWRYKNQIAACYSQPLE